jgi:hypothetical protein
VANRINPAVNGVQATAIDPVGNRVAVESRIEELRARNDSMLPPRQTRDLPIRRCALCSTVYSRFK